MLLFVRGSLQGNLQQRFELGSQQVKVAETTAPRRWHLLRRVGSLTGFEVVPCLGPAVTLHGVCELDSQRARVVANHEVHQKPT